MRTAALLVLTAAACSSPQKEPPQAGDRALRSPEVGPYLQSPGTGQATIVWQDRGPADATVRYGFAADTLDESADARDVGRHPRMRPGLTVREATLGQLPAGAVIHYQLSWEAARSPVYRFRMPAPGENATVRFAVYSDPQRDPSIHRRITEAIAATAGDTDQSLADRLSFVLVAGDLVHVGADGNEWPEKFFDPAATYLPEVPVYPALGNHEYQGLDDGERSPFLDQFHLPRNGSPDYPEEWYSFQRGGIRSIVLNSNHGAVIQYKHHPQLHNPEAAAVQRQWLDKELDDACADDDTQFVLATFHHPGQSELWGEGDEEHSQALTELLGEKLDRCGKAGVAFTGHTHGYARGQLPNYPVYALTVASAGGHLDRWGEYENVDHDWVEKTFSTYGFVIGELSADELRLRRYRIGSEPGALGAPVVEDEMLLRTGNRSPATPRVTAANRDEPGLTLRATSFADDDGDSHAASHWQLIDGDEHTVWEKIFQRENWYLDRNLNAELNLRELTITEQETDATHVRVRYRDSALGWSAWSEPQPVNQGDR